MTAGELPRSEHDRVSAILVHSSDRPVAPQTLTSVRALDVDGRPPEVCIVDLSAAGPPPWWTDHDDIKVIGGAVGIGLAAARNRGAAVATHPILLFLDATATVPRDLLHHASEVLHRDGGLAAVGFNVDGRGIPTLTFAGLPGRPKFSSSSDLVPVLYPWAEAFAVRNAAFHEMGGFDERYDRAGEEVDLGWRLWLLGHRVAFDSASPVELGEPAPVDIFNDTFLRERNALATIHKHYDPALLGRALPAALALATVRAGRAGAPTAPPTAAAIQSFTELLPELEITRQQLAARRRRPDHEILPLFRSAFEVGSDDDELRSALDRVLDGFQLRDTFGSARRIIVATPDVFTKKMAGPAIRAWHIASALATDHEVQLVTTSDLCEVESDAFIVRTADNDEFAELEAWCDVIILQGFVLEGRPFLRDTKKVMVVDLYDPLHLEQLELTKDDGDLHRRFSVRNSTRVLNEQLLRGDFFVCASRKQRDFWLGQLSGLGRVNPLTYDEDETMNALLAVVPFGLPDAAPVRTRRALKGVVPGIAADDEVILWGGGIYNWFDPLTLVEAIDLLRRRRPNVRLFFMGLRHPNPDVEEMRMARATRELSGRLGLTDTHVFFNEDWVAYDDRQNYLLDADVGVSCHLDHIETAFSFRTRILDYIWAALPIVATEGDSFAEMIEAEEAGLTVPPGDVVALERALFRILDDEPLRRACRQNLTRVRNGFAWSTTLQPLVEFCRAPRRAPDLVDPEMAPTLAIPSAGHAARSGSIPPGDGAAGRLRFRELENVLVRARSRLSRPAPPAE